MYIPRTYQDRLIKGSVRALKREGNSLVIMSTGGGKTVVFSHVGKEIGGRVCVLQHRDELVAQNARTFGAVNTSTKVTRFDATEKKWGGATFAMVQTLINHDVERCDIVMIDEAHHVAAPTYQTLLSRFRDVNPDVMILGVTATPERADRKSLRGTFSNVAGKVDAPELISLGFLVPPRTYVVDLGLNEALSAIETGDFGEQAEVAKLFNVEKVTASVIREWQAKGEGRSTVIFCASVEHARTVAKAFTASGVPAASVDGTMGKDERRSILTALEAGELKVVTNCMVLTEGWDCPPVSCCILLRKCSAKSTMIQMIGRVLRLHSGKVDAFVWDFGTSLLTHGDLMMGDGLSEPKKRKDGVEIEPPLKKCPQGRNKTYLLPNSHKQIGCGAEIPANMKVCPLCGFIFERIVPDDLGYEQVSLTEIDILNLSPFRWVELFEDPRLMMASGFDAWAIVTTLDGERWQAVGGRGHRLEHLGTSSRLVAVAMADDFMRRNESSASARKSRSWLSAPATEGQCEMLNRFGFRIRFTPVGNSAGLTKYMAACYANWYWHDSRIIPLLKAKQ